MHTHKQVQEAFHAEISRAWESHRKSVPKDERYPRVRGADEAALKVWAGVEDDGLSLLTVKDWLRHGPNQSDLYGDQPEAFRGFCERVGVDYVTLLGKQPVARRGVFKERVRGKLNQYKKKTGRSMKELAEHLGWSETDYQWLRRVATKGVDHPRSKKKQLAQLASELDTTLDYLFGTSEAVELPTWNAIIALGIEAFARRQPEGTYYADPQKVREYLIGGW